ncbi:hypothetical protein HBI23_071800 [Parastagonospora nodorum]|nr:hypothetical protein HBI12_051840 [Parastagonospora nodorum]KAH5433791.1 hypothetical protein HBI47_089770 [Parastagonospora nodorum]KAH5665573.1 hypothetical protein HBI23_071800 [Parastagonospora nodorum]KAH6229149.1 hypothetical protein HBI43_052870 [Parastagonospora nodorum]KAH6268053.1 hypothetical protein HBI42_044310 [Parastagonospora nodorum]
MAEILIQPLPFAYDSHYAGRDSDFVPRNVVDTGKVNSREKEIQEPAYNKPAGQASPISASNDDQKRAMFRYEPLDFHNKTLRLLEVSSDAPGTIIRCNVRAVHLSDKPVYAALSYTWDTSVDCDIVMCNDKPLQVRRNLSNFLHEFRTKLGNSNISLWVDAICINQADILERNHQVAQMRDIYSNAVAVISWLGQTFHDVSTAFGMVAGAQKLTFTDGQDNRGTRSGRQWKALARLLNRPYWTRVWIIQEFLVAKSLEIWCGRHKAAWTDVEHICQSLQRFAELSMPHPESQFVLESRGYVLSQQKLDWCLDHNVSVPQYRHTLSQLLEVYSASQSSDIRDKVYALLGVAHDVVGNEHPITVDYSKTSAQVLVDVVRNQCRWGSAVLDTKNHLFIKFLEDALQVSHAEVVMCALQCAPDLHHHIYNIATDERLYATMRCIGTIIEVGFELAVDGLKSKRRCREWHRHGANIHIDPRRLSGSTTSALVQLLVDPNSQDILSIDVSDSHGRSVSTAGVGTGAYMPADRSVKVFERDLPCPIQQRHRAAMREKHSEINIDSGFTSASEIRHIFFGTNGIVGITSGPAQCGDIVCVFPDANNEKTAIILRQPKDYGQLRTIGTALYSAHAVDIGMSAKGTTTQANYLSQPSHADMLYLQHRPNMNDPIYDYRRPICEFRVACETRVSVMQRTKWSGRKFAYSAPPNNHLIGNTIRFYCHPLCLPNLARHRMLKYYCIPRRLELAIEAQSHGTTDQRTKIVADANLHPDGELRADELRKAKAMWNESKAEKAQSARVGKWISAPTRTSDWKNCPSNSFIGGAPDIRSDLPRPPLDSEVVKDEKETKKAKD